MVNIVANYSLEDLGTNIFSDTTILSDSTSEIVTAVSDGTYREYTGNFAYNSAGQLIGGTWTGLSGALANGTVFYNATGINVPVAVYAAYYYSHNGLGLIEYALNGNDSITGSSQSDILFGFGGNDTITSGGGNDIINGNQGNDSIIGGSGNSLLLGGQGDDTIHAGSGSSVVNGNLGNDVIYGDTGSSLLQGGQGNDTIYAGTGRDTVAGNLGNDLLYSGAGAPTTFLFSYSSGNDTISGLKAGDAIDILINVNGSNIVSYQTLAPHISNVSGNAVIDLGGGNHITLLGINPANLNAGDFIFV